MLSPGDEVDRYEVEKLLGEGGTAVVYRVRHRTLGTLHALKVPTASSQGMLRRLVEEGKAQARLVHPNLVRVTDVIDVGGLPGLLMEYVEGSNLLDLLSRGPLHPAEAERLFREILAGVGFAHQQGFVHRDLKPANILLTSGPKGPVPKITDFGLAKAWMEEDHGHTRTGWVMGTPGYMSPEQIQNAKAVDPRTDLFAMGAILYEMLIGRPAFTGGTLAQIFMAVQMGTYVPPERTMPTLPAHLVAAIRACLMVDREKRVSSAEELVEVLDGRRLWRVGPAPADTLVEQEPATAAPRRRGSTWPLLIGGMATLLGIFSTFAVLLVVVGPLAPEPKVDASNGGGLPQVAALEKPAEEVRIPSAPVPPPEAPLMAPPPEAVPLNSRGAPGGEAARRPAAKAGGTPTPELVKESPVVADKIVNPGKLTVNSRPGQGRFEVIGGPSADTWSSISLPPGSYKVVVTCEEGGCSGKKSSTLSVTLAEGGTEVLCWDFDLQNRCR
ncbi:MAG TPA: protein kinase [Myxococcota bacterium]|nr:protein kinase [Myxococcota bacterium]